MIVKRIRYAVADGRIEENKKAIAAFIAEAVGLEGGSYSSFQVGDSGEFMHLAIFENEAAKDRFFALPGFKPFAEGLKDRTLETPHVDDLSLVASSMTDLRG
jgi:hypothetical protein